MSEGGEVNNREWLYSLDVADLSDWFDAEHQDVTRSDESADTSNKTGEDVTDSRGRLNAIRAQFGAGPTSMTDDQIEAMSEHYRPKKEVDMVIVDELHDSREKLEADVRQILHSAYMLAWMHGHENRRGSSFEKLHVEFYNLLDRQAAITERECSVGHTAMRATIDRLQTQVYELEKRLAGNARHPFAEALLASLDSRENELKLQERVDELQAAYDELTAIAAQLCRACGFSMVDANGEVVS